MERGVPPLNEEERVYMPQEYTRVLVGIDGSEEAKIAMQKAVEIAKRNHATLVIAHVVDTRTYQGFSTFDGTLPERIRKEIKATLEEYRLLAEKAGLEKVKALLKYGPPKKMLAQDIPMDENIDLIVMGATGLNAIERAFLGSISGFVMRHALCDVLIVRTDLHNLPIKD